MKIVKNYFPLICWPIALLFSSSLLGQMNYEWKDDYPSEKLQKDSLKKVEDSLCFRNKIKRESFEFYPKGKGKSQIVLYVPSEKNPRRAISNTFVVLGASVAGMVILYNMPESVTNWTDEDRDLSNALGKWSENIKDGPVVDEDNFFLNWVMHPYFGAVYYQSMRGAGYNWKASFLYSVLASSLYWEYGIEALAEIPSLQDLIITPVVGSALGEGFFRLKLEIKKSHDRILGSLFLGRTSLFLLDPLNEVHDIFLKKSIKKRMKPNFQLSSFVVPSPQQKGIAFGVNLSF